MQIIIFIIVWIWMHKKMMFSTNVDLIKLQSLQIELEIALFSMNILKCMALTKNSLRCAILYDTL